MGSAARCSTLLLPLAAALLGPGAPGGASAQSAQEIMQRERDLHRVRDEEERQAMKLVDRTGAVKHRRLVRYTMKGASGLTKILIRFTAPRDVEDTAVLTWEARDGNDDQWLYLPATRQAKRIPPSGKRNRFMGTDFTYEDLRDETVTANTYTLVGSEAVDGQACYVIEAVPATEQQAANSAYGKRRLWVRKDNYFIVKRELYDRAGKLKRVRVDRNLVPVTATAWRGNEVEMRDVQEGTRTIVTMERRAVDKGLKESLFSEAGLARGGS